MPKSVKIVGYANDIAVVTVAQKKTIYKRVKEECKERYKIDKKKNEHVCAPEKDKSVLLVER